MKQPSWVILSCGLAIALICLSSAEALATPPKHVTLSAESDSGYTYSGTGVDGLPGTTLPDSRRRPRVYNDFASFDASVIGDTLSMTYDILLGGTADPGNESQDWRFGFINSSANGGKGVSLGAYVDIGDLVGTVAYEFGIDTALTTGLGTPPSGEMDSAFVSTLNDPADGTAQFAKVDSVLDPFADDVALNDRTDTHRFTLTLERTASGYDLSFSFKNLVSGNELTNAATITTIDPDPSIALAAGITSWDRLGFFINDNSIDADSSPYVYTISNLGVSGNASSLALASTWSTNEYQTIPEPGTALLMLLGLATFTVKGRKHG